eukprot:TRINITY_DN3562_c0_g1_i1.p1 TRINITY_DN3562_c0_g1~~TRINITY_DN3562_c0_g1_i1.p1  ORF type:complete len:554 (-),score=8.70 TRINITY_DN3562_c0_g1_i1:332-1993(-)
MRLVLVASLLYLVSGLELPIPGDSNGIVTYNGTVTNGTYTYFTLSIPLASAYGMDWTLTLTGPVDLYVNQGSPSLTSGSYSNTEDLNTKSIFLNACNLTSNVWYVVVYGSSSPSADYSLTSVTVPRSCRETTMTDNVSNGSMKLYMFTIPSEDAFEWTVSLTGSADLYIRDYQPPTTSEYYTFNVGNDTTKSVFFPSCGFYRLFWYVGVYGTGPGSSPFTLTSTIRYRPCLINLPSTPISLNDTVTASNMQFFVFNVSDPNLEWELTLTGSADLYINLGSLPDNLEGWGPISPSTSIINACDMTPGIWYVGVASSATTSYTLTSIPRTRYCRIYLPLDGSDTSNITGGTYQIISLSFPSSNPSNLVSLNLEWTLTLFGSVNWTLPWLAGNSTWDSSSDETLHTRTIFADACMMVRPTMEFTIYASDTTDYRIVSQTSNSIPMLLISLESRPCVIDLPSNTTTSGIVHNGHLHYFRFTIPPYLWIEWTISTNNSDTQLYVTQDDYPSTSVSDYRTDPGSTNLTITLQTMMPMYVGVYGSGRSPSSYTLDSRISR